MDVREKLIEILRKPIFPHELVDQTEAVADYLLDNCVTVQERNNPITMAALWKMDGEPVWVVYADDEGMWALVEVCEESIFLTNNLGGRTEYADDVELEDDGLTVYRQKPKGE